MPKRIGVKDSKQLYISYKIGAINGKNQYGAVFPIRGVLSSFVGERTVNFYGVEFKYDASVIVEYNEATKYIDEFTKFWNNKKPNSGNDKSNYTIVRIGEVRDGLFTVYLRSNTFNANNIWYEIDGKIYVADVNFDFTNLIATTLSNVYMPMWYNTKVWYKEPTDTNDTNGALRLISIESENGYNKYIFEEA